MSVGPLGVMYTLCVMLVLVSTRTAFLIVTCAPHVSLAGHVLSTSVQTAALMIKAVG
jgi:hypothetical protein